jgi:hypothetical protein
VKSIFIDTRVILVVLCFGFQQVTSGCRLVVVAVFLKNVKCTVKNERKLGAGGNVKLDDGQLE